MTTTAIQEAAIRNRAARLAQIERLQPKRLEAREKANELYELKQSVAGIRAGHQEMAKLMRIPGFYPTLMKVIEVMMVHADINPGDRVLESSAGKGNICRALLAAGASVFAIEINPALVAILRGIVPDALCTDFLSIDPVVQDWFKGGFDRVVINPPFENRQDEAHILRSMHYLKPGGRLVAVASNPTCRRLTSWARDTGGDVIDLPENSFQFAERSTGVHTGLVIANAA